MKFSNYGQNRTQKEIRFGKNQFVLYSGSKKT